MDNRPELPEGTFPEYYVAVPIDKVLPSTVPHEILEELYIPEEDPAFNEETEIQSKRFTQKGVINDNEDLLRHLLNEAYTLTGNEADLLEEEPKTDTNVQAKWIFGSRWWPSGTLKIWDDNAGTRTTTTRIFSHWEYYDCGGDNRGAEEKLLTPIGEFGDGDEEEDEICRNAIYRTVTNPPIEGKYVPLVGAQVC